MDLSVAVLAAALPALRGASLAAVMSAFGALVFCLVVLRGGVIALDRAEAEASVVAVRRIVRISALAALPLTAIWMVLQAAAIADTTSLRATFAVLPDVIAYSRFGTLAAIRFTLLIAACLLMRGPGPIQSWALVPIGAALWIQACIGHAAAAGGTAGAGLVMSEILHVSAAAAWLGGLLPLAVVIVRLEPRVAAAVSHGFFPVGIACVLILAGTGLAQGAALIGGLPGLLGTAYGRVALLKIGLFLVLLALAAANRFSFTAGLAAAHPGKARRRLLGSVAAETVLGLTVVFAAASLASLPPGMHEQPLWPFADRPSLVAMADPDLRREVGEALAAIVGGIALVATSIFVRRFRWAAVAAGAALIALAAPHLDLLFVEAEPTSFYTSPTGFAAASISHGQMLYAQNCASCHGSQGHGDGPAAKRDNAPADLTAGHLWDHADGELFWWLSHGIDNPEGGLAMPGFANRLSEDERWAVIDFLHANNAGLAIGTGDAWPRAVQAPDMDVLCADGQPGTISSLRGRILQVIAGDARPPGDGQAGDRRGAVTLMLRRRQGAESVSALPASACVAGGPEDWQAIAIVTGLSPDRLAGAEVLIDAQGWLRFLSRPGDSGAAYPRIPAAKLADIATHPLASPAGDHVHHH